MPVIDGRLTCCSCGADLGDAEDPYLDPDCEACEKRRLVAEMEQEAEDESLCWAADAEAAEYPNEQW